MTLNSALYMGEVVHARHKPRQHTLRYSVFCLLLDLDELPALDGSLRLLSHNRWGIFGFRDSDHGLGETGRLKDWVAGHLQEVGLNVEELQVEVLCYPRIFGYVFNPLTVYFCHGPDRALRAILYEVCNTFGERHTYVIPATAEADGSIKHSCAKQMYVSPFIPMDCSYQFKIAPPGEHVQVSINEADGEGPLLYASFAGKRRELTDRQLLKALVTYPLMTLKVMGAIHWEALRLWLKGVPLYRHEAASQRIASSIIVPKAESGSTPT